MSSFFVVVNPGGDAAATTRMLAEAEAQARRLKRQSACCRHETPWAGVLGFERRDGSCPGFAADEASGDWLLAAGTCFRGESGADPSAPALLARYREVGAEGLARELEGFFAIVIGDAARREVRVITDIVGSLHCYAREVGGAHAISGSSLLLAGLASVELDPVGAEELLQMGILYEDRSLFRGVRKLPAASVIAFGAGAAERYWDPATAAADRLAGDAAIDTLWQQLTRAARQVATRFANPVCDLTGGYDSRAMVAALRGAESGFATTVSGPDGSPDVRIAAELAAKLGLPHWHLNPRDEAGMQGLKDALALTDGEYDVVDYARILGVHEQLRTRHDVSINGSFGEVARGYWWELLAPRTGRIERLDADRLARKRYAAAPYDPALSFHANGFDLAGHMRGVVERTNAGLEGTPNTLQMDNAYLRMRMHRWQGRIASSTDQVWPCLSPFMFRPVLETMLRVVPRQRRGGLLIRQVLARYQPVLANHPLEHGYPAVPMTLRTAWRFWPMATNFAAKAARKALATAGIRMRSGAGGRAPHERLWDDEAVRAILDPGRMELGSYIDPTRLRSFLQRSREAGFGFAGQWGRLITIELALRALGR